MASDKPNNVLPTNIQIKMEPGTSVPVTVRNIKVEPGLTASTTRLTSFRLPRDLTLGGNIKTEKPKKVYIPNLNVQRNKKKDDVSSSKNDSNNVPKNHHNKGRKDHKDRRNKPNNLIQSSGVFSQGINDASSDRRYSGSRGGGGGRSGIDSSDRTSSVLLEKPKLNLNRVIDKTEEEEKLKAILRDDFVDDGLEIDLNNAPVMLPMIEQKVLYKDHKLETDSKSDICLDAKPVIVENGTAIKSKDTKIKNCVQIDSLGGQDSVTIPQIIENKNNSYILIQLPDCLPGLASNDESNEPKPKKSSNEQQNTNKEYCNLSSLKGGLLGKIQILKSGKARLCLGENSLVIDVGSHTSFRQDLIATKIDPDKSKGDLINLGPINSTLICSPDWESMLVNL